MSWLFISLFVGFFFFKQKTAYEMRISDWSSDVCSSDLWREPVPQLLDLGYVPAAPFGERGLGEAGGDADPHPAGDQLEKGEALGRQIGRESCRERVVHAV